MFGFNSEGNRATEESKWCNDVRVWRMDQKGATWNREDELREDCPNPYSLISNGGNGNGRKPRWIPGRIHAHWEHRCARFVFCLENIPEYRKKIWVKSKGKMEPDAKNWSHQTNSTEATSVVFSLYLTKACTWWWANHFPQSQCFNILLGIKIKLVWRRMWFGNRLKINKWNGPWKMTMFSNMEHSLW